MKVDPLPSEVAESHYRRAPPTAARMFADSLERLKDWLPLMANNEAWMHEIHQIEDLEDKQVASAMFTQMCADEEAREMVERGQRDDTPSEAARHAKAIPTPPPAPCTREQVDNALYAYAAVLGPIAAEPILEMRVSPQKLESKLAYVKARCLDITQDRIRSPERLLLSVMRSG